MSDPGSADDVAAYQRVLTGGVLALLEGDEHAPLIRSFDITENLRSTLMPELDRSRPVQGHRNPRVSRVPSDHHAFPRSRARTITTTSATTHAIALTARRYVAVVTDRPMPSAEAYATKHSGHFGRSASTTAGTIAANARRRFGLQLHFDTAASTTHGRDREMRSSERRNVATPTGFEPVLPA